jgi:hypothetical protein
MRGLLEGWRAVAIVMSSGDYSDVRYGVLQGLGLYGVKNSAG